MADDVQPKARFEPPPWERDAFERFQAERQAQRDADEQARRAELEGARVFNSPGATFPEKPPGASEGASEEQSRVSDAQITEMLMGLRAEEPPAARTNKPMFYTVIGLLVGAGVLMVVQALTLFGQTRAEGSGGMLAVAASLLVLLTGMGFVATAALLFRKYQR